MMKIDKKTVNIAYAVGGVLILMLLTRNKASAASSSPGAADMSLLGLSYLGTNGPRGQRNNNPGNIRISSSPWQGKVPVAQNTDGAFEQFTAYAYGVRAMIKLLQNYISAGHNTIQKIIERYAPAADNNNVAAYVNAVASRSGLSPNATLSIDYNTLSRLVPAMATHETGQSDAVTPGMLAVAWSIL